MKKKELVAKRVMMCRNWEELESKVQADTETLGLKVLDVLNQHCDYQNPYDQEVILNALLTIVAWVAEEAEHDGIDIRENVMKKFDAWIECYREKRRELGR